MKKCLLFFIVLVSCGPSQKAKNNLESLKSFVSDVELGWTNYKEKDWISADSTLNIYEAYFDKEELDLLTVEERSEYNSLIGKYSGIKAGYKSHKFLDNLKENMTDIGNKAKGFTEGLIKTIDSSILK